MHPQSLGKNAPGCALWGCGGLLAWKRGLLQLVIIALFKLARKKTAVNVEGPGSPHMTDRKLTGGHSSAARRSLVAAALPVLKGQLPFSEEYWPAASLEKMSQCVHFQEHCFQSPGSLPHPGPNLTPLWARAVHAFCRGRGRTVSGCGCNHSCCSPRGLNRTDEKPLSALPGQPRHGGQVGAGQSSRGPVGLAAGALTLLPRPTPPQAGRRCLSQPALPGLLLLFFSLLSWLQFASSGLFTIWLLWFLI